MSEPLDDDFTEIVDAEITRVDLVGKGANGLPFLIAKNEAGIVPPDMVRDLIGKADPEPVAEISPPATKADLAAIAKMIHEAPTRRPDPVPPTVQYIPWQPAQTVDHAGIISAAMSHQPVQPLSELVVAKAEEERPPQVIQHITITQPVGKPEEIAAAVTKAMKQYGSTNPPTSKEPAVAEPIVKDDPVDADPGEIDLTDPLADSTDILAESMPGSAAWEQLDADSAMKWTAVLARAKNALEVLSSRELMESDSPLGDGDDVDNAWDLEDACCAIDFAIGTLAAYAVGEQATSEQMDEMASMQKAAAGIDPAALAVLEELGPIIKLGRSISAASEAKLVNARDSISDVLATLPPPAVDDSVAKSQETVVTDPEPTPEPEPAVVAKGTAGPASAPVSSESNAEKVAKMMNALGVQAPSAELIENVVSFIPVEVVEKAKAADPLTPIYDQNGDLVGMVDATNVIPIAPAAPAAAPADESDAAPDDAATPPDATVAAPQPPDAATIPGTATVQAPPDDSVAKATGEKLDALIEALAVVAKQSGEQTELATIVKDLQERVDHIAKMPDDRKSPRLNGATGTAQIAVRDGSELDPYAELRKAAEEETDPIKKRAAGNALLFAGIRDRVLQHP